MKISEKNALQVMILVTSSDGQIHFPTIYVSVVRFNKTERPLTSRKQNGFHNITFSFNEFLFGLLEFIHVLLVDDKV